MDNLNEDILINLPKDLQMAFGLTIVERMLPNYLKYIQLGNLGNYYLFRITTDKLWEFAKSHKNIEKITEIQLSIENQIPDADSVTWTNWTSAALDLATALTELLNFTKNGNLSHLKMAIQASIDSVYMNVNDPKDLQLTHYENIVKDMSDSIVQRELKIQQETLKFIDNFKDDINRCINSLYDQWHNTKEGSLNV